MGAPTSLSRLKSPVAVLLACVLLQVACNDDRPLDRSGPGGIPSETTQTASPGETPSPADIDEVAIELKPTVSGLESPLLVTHAGDGSNRMFIIEQPGRIRIVSDGELLVAPFLDVSDAITAGGEQGLLGLAFHPDYESNGRFFIDYTDAEGNDVVAEYAVSSDPNVADPASERLLVEIDDPFSNHNGGHLAFGEDGYLYIATGDGGGGGDPLESGQNLDTLLGKLLRIDVDSSTGELPYGIPSDNPFANRNEARREIWAYGLRNPWRFSFDRGDIWIGDVGQSALEEINRMPASRAGLNYGWNTIEGDACFDPPFECDRSGMVLPITTYTHDEGCSVTGGYVYRGGSFPSLQGVYFFADYCSGFIWSLDAAGRGQQTARRVLESERSISSFGLDESGELYLTDIDSGEVLQVVASS
jgi:glucose/arabinose dehydrogenase